MKTSPSPVRYRFSDAMLRGLAFFWLTILFTAPPAAALDWKSARLGNIFVTGEAVELPLQVDADAVDWQITDFWHKTVEAASGTVSGGKTVIKPKVTAVGYYLIHVTPKKAGVAAADGYTSFAIVRRHVSKDPLSSPFGVMTHFAQGMDPAMLPAFKQIGIESIRDEHYWAQVEAARGVYHFPPYSDAYMAACKKDGIDPLVIMDFGNGLYGDKEGPTSLSGYTAYANYGEAILKHYGDQIHWLEVWNEYNGTWCPAAAREDRPAYYTEMLRTAYEKIKSVRPDVQVLGGAAVLIPLPYFEDIFKFGGLKYMDGVVIHPYRDKPEGVDAEVSSLRELIRKYNGGKDKPIWATENGRYSRDEYDWETGRKMYEKGRAEGARYLARQYTLLLKEKVAKIYWYLSSDHMEFVGMGLLRHHSDEASGMGLYAVAPAYVSYANLIEQLDGAEFVQHEAMSPYSRVHVELFRRGAEDIRVCWATQPAKIRVQAAQPLKIADLMGAEATLTPAQGETALNLTEDAVYLHGKVDALSEINTGSQVVASSQDDYSSVQGANGWYYGYFIGDGPFQELTQTSDMWGNKWALPGKFLNLSQGGTHPEKEGNKDQPSVRRWKSPVEGHLKIKASWANEGQGDGVTVSILVDGKPVFSKPVGVGGVKKVEAEVQIVVKVGSLVDFVCGPNANINFDETPCDFVIVRGN